ncbi:MAG: hypothetical protein N2692_02590 [Patescibacteria group bacterium]|jgi:hypothetical protein|nr:hypothetical protein [Patescibacteria group bacterium]
MAFFVCVVEKDLRMEEAVFTTRMYWFTKAIEKESKVKMKLIFHFDKGKISWAEIRPRKQKHPLVVKRGGLTVISFFKNE